LKVCSKFQVFISYSSHVIVIIIIYLFFFTEIMKEMAGIVMSLGI